MHRHRLAEILRHVVELDVVRAIYDVSALELMTAHPFAAGGVSHDCVRKNGTLNAGLVMATAESRPARVEGVRSTSTPSN
jgi:hypothetical protein